MWDHVLKPGSKCNPVVYEYIVRSTLMAVEKILIDEKNTTACCRLALFRSICPVERDLGPERLTDVADAIMVVHLSESHEPRVSCVMVQPLGYNNVATVLYGIMKSKEQRNWW